VTPTLRFDEVAVGQELPTLERVVGPEDIHAYAEASGDRNPLHLDEEAARAAGFPGVIAHGMFTMGHLGSCLTRWAGAAAAITHLRAAFRSPVMTGDRIVAGGRITSLDAASRRATLEVWVSVERDGAVDHAIRRSRAEVRLA
jgi:meromycolic acid (3R)-3-hydroxyacyl-[acyl-carrier protein] dehydratase HadB